MSPSAMSGRMIAVAIGSLLIAAWGIPAALAQPYPTKPLRIFTQYVPGASGDTTIRIMAAKS
jgi:tripartite-type tricarboxylate transporter receptor subunit TctC